MGSYFSEETFIKRSVGPPRPDVFAYPALPLVSWGPSSVTKSVCNIFAYKKEYFLKRLSWDPSETPKNITFSVCNTQSKVSGGEHPKMYLNELYPGPTLPVGQFILKGEGLAKACTD